MVLSDGVVGHVGGSVRGRAQYGRDCHEDSAGFDHKTLPRSQFAYYYKPP